MSLQKTFSALTFVASACLVTACGGGGGSLNDGLTPLRTEGQSVTLQSATASCPPAASGVTLYVFGGVAPYTLRNTVPDQVGLSNNSIGSAGEGVSVRFLGGCLTSVPLVVVDKNGTTVSVPLSYLPSST